MKKRFLIWDNPKDAIISLTLLLMLVGCINVFSASFVEARDMLEDGYYYLKRYLIFGAAGLMLMLWLGFRAPSYKTWLNDFWLKAIYFGVGSLLLVCGRNFYSAFRVGEDCRDPSGGSSAW